MIVQNEFGGLLRKGGAPEHTAGRLGGIHFSSLSDAENNDPRV